MALRRDCHRSVVKIEVSNEIAVKWFRDYSTTGLCLANGVTYDAWLRQSVLRKFKCKHLNWGWRKHKPFLIIYFDTDLEALEFKLTWL